MQPLFTSLMLVLPPVKRYRRAHLHLYYTLCLVFRVYRQAAPPGIRQWMERKAGAIRQRMQGKRVNYAARTVLAPDGLLAPNEVSVQVLGVGV